MKICPKCHSSYSDETLNFCLTDGVPLVVEEAFGARNSGSQHSWQEAETLHDAGFVLPSAGEHTTSPNSGSPTFASAASHNTSIHAIPAKKSSNRVLLSIVGALLAVGITAGVFWYFAGRGGGSVTNSQTSIPSATVKVKKTSVTLSDEQENQIKKEITGMLEVWRSTIEKHDIDTHMKSYVATLDNYYKESGFHHEQVRADKLRAFARYPAIDIQIDNLKITPQSTDAATVLFDKTWTFKNPQRTSTGSVQQEMELVKQDGKWLINGEKDAKVYYINNRDNESDNTNQTADEGGNTKSN
ncbi:MAG TPA: hypothetical protein VF599_01530 [Pyrinomonadaceae bacterium]|jgi:hypothetical protein